MNIILGLVGVGATALLSFSLALLVSFACLKGILQLMLVGRRAR